MGKGGDGKRVGTEKREGKLSKAKQGCVLKRLGIDNKKRLGTEKVEERKKMWGLKKVGTNKQVNY